MTRDAKMVITGIVVAMMLPLLVIGLKLPLWMCAALAAAAFVVIGLVLRPEAHTVEIEAGAAFGHARADRQQPHRRRRRRAEPAQEGRTP